MHKLLPGAPGTLPNDSYIVYPTLKQFPAQTPLPSLSKGCRFAISGHCCTALPSSACYRSCTMQAVWMSTVLVNPRVATQTGAEGQVVSAQAKVSPHASSSPALLHPSSDLSVGMLSTDCTVYSRSSCMSTTQCLVLIVKPHCINSQLLIGGVKGIGGCHVKNDKQRTAYVWLCIRPVDCCSRAPGGHSLTPGAPSLPKELAAAPPPASSHHKSLHQWLRTASGNRLGE